MAYFSHAYKKVFIAEEFVTTGSPQDLTWGQIGFFDAKTWEAIAVADADIVEHPQAVLAMGTFHGVDKIGPHGGYKESIKSKVIDPRYIQGFWKVEADDAQQHFIQVGWDGTNEDTSPQFKCGRTYRLRIDLKGSPALRFLGHHLYYTFEYHTGCCAQIGEAELVDPLVVLLGFAQQINEHPFFSNLLGAGVITGDGPDVGSAPDFVDADSYVPKTDQAEIATTMGALQLNVQAENTEFYGCSFELNDHYETEPLVITSVQLVDDSSDPCGDFKQLQVTEISAAKASRGTTGTKVIQDFVLSQAYGQERYSDRVRYRLVQDMELTGKISIGSAYDTYYILYGVPRRSNPSGVYDCDQYLIQLHTLEDIDMTDFIAWVNAYAGSAGTGVVLEDYSGVI